MAIHDDFLRAIHERKLVKIKANTFEKGIVERICVPFDFGPAKGGPNKYQFWSLDSPKGPHNLPLLPAQLLTIEVTPQVFEPGKYVTWPPPFIWIVERDWGNYS